MEPEQQQQKIAMLKQQLEDSKQQLEDSKQQQEDLKQKVVDLKQQLSSLSEISPPAPKKNKQAESASDLELQPSSATWKKLAEKKILPSFPDFFCQIQSNDRTSSFTPPDTESSSGVVDSIKTVNHSINLYGTPLNEGFSTLICGNIIAGIMAELNKPQKYKFEIDPIVFKHPTDGRKDKKSDSTIIRIVNKRTVVVIELKLEVCAAITGGAKDNLAQLFYEGKLVCETEKKNYTKLLCIYANHTTWHIFVMDYSKVTLCCEEYYSYPLLNESVTCKLISDMVHHINLIPAN